MKGISVSSLSIEQWITLIGAVTSAIVAILNAWKGQKIEQKVDEAKVQLQEHEAASSARAAAKEPYQ